MYGDKRKLVNRLRIKEIKEYGENGKTFKTF